MADRCLFTSGWGTGAVVVDSQSIAAGGHQHALGQLLSSPDNVGRQGMED